MVKTSALYTKGRRFESHRRRFFTPTVVLLSFNKPETVLWTIAKYYYYYYLVSQHQITFKMQFFSADATMFQKNPFGFVVDLLNMMASATRGASKFSSPTPLIIIIIIIFCYSPKHCFRLIEGQQSTIVDQKPLLNTNHS